MIRPVATSLGAALSAAASIFALAVASRAWRPSVQRGAQDATVEIVVASTTDVHGRLRGWDYYAGAPDALRGLARAATVVDSVRAANPGRLVLVDAGDLLQGNPLAYVAARVDSGGPHPVVAAMNAMRYDAAAVGNHEFNYGVPTLMKAARRAEFPFLAANAWRADGRRAFAASRIVERRGLRIGIVGATTPGAMVWDRDNLAGRLELRDLVPDVASAVRDVRRGGADIVVVVMHSGISGASSYDTVATAVPSENVGARVAREVPGIDLIVIGHSHREVADTTINGVLLVQPRNWATSVSVATLAAQRDNGHWRVVRKRGVLVRAVGHPESPAVLRATARAHEATVRWVDQSLGTTPVAWRADSARVADVPLLDFVLEVQRRAAGADLAATAAFDLGASLDAGPVTIAEIARLYPYDNTLRAVRISGAQLRQFLEHSARYYRGFDAAKPDQSPVDPAVPGYNFDVVSGVDYTIDISRPPGSRVTRLSFKGRPVEEAQQFTLALNNYRQTGGGGYAMLRGAPVVYDRQEEVRDLLIAEVRRRRTLQPADYRTVNWSLAPAEAIPPAYRAMRASAFDASGTAARPASPSAPVRRLRIIATNDFHGGFEARTDSGGVRRGGAPQLATAIRAARTECAAPECVSVWLDGGDEFQGTAASNFAFGRPVVELFNALGLSASALGNHDFDWGLDSLRARMRDARYALLAANVRDTAGGTVPWIRADTMIALPGLKVGVIGVANVETPKTTQPRNVATLRFLDPAPIVDARARALRAAGADVVVVVAHEGAFCERGKPSQCDGRVVDLARRVTERVDAIVGGHTHSPVSTVVGGVPVVEAYSRGSAVGIIDIPLGGSGVARVWLRNVLADSLPADSAAAVITRRALDAVAVRMRRPVAAIAERMEVGTAGTLGNLVADAQRSVAKADVAVMNRGGLRAPLAAGDATFGSIFEVQPFGNVLVRITLGGADLRAYLERLVSRQTIDFFLSGARVVYDPDGTTGRRIESVVLSNGRQLDPRGVYTLAMLDFLAAGGDGLALTERARSVEELPVTDVEALERYLRAQPAPVRPPADARLVARRR